MKFYSQIVLGALVVLFLWFAPQHGGAADEPPAVSVLEGVGFIADSARLQPGSDTALEKLLAELVADASLTVEIRCHVASSGDAQQVAKLSRQRAETLRRWLMSRGVAFYRLQIADPQTAAAASGLPPEMRAPAGDRVEIARIRKSFPVADVPAPRFRFEPVADGQQVLHDFLLTNRGDAPLNISKVRTG